MRIKKTHVVPKGGNVIAFPQRRHGWAASDAGALTDARVSSVRSDRPKLSASRTSANQRPGGMPRPRHLLTVESSSSSPAATAAVPPSPSMTVSGVMNLENSWQTANRQGLANRQLTEAVPCGQIPLMSQQAKIIGDRLRRTRIALNLNLTDFAKLVGTDKGTYSHIEDGDRNFTLAMAIKLKRKKGIPLDWVYCADPARLPTDVFQNLDITEVA